MDLLFKREQSAGELIRVTFKLWGKIELDEEEQALISRYDLANAMLIEVLQPGLRRQGLAFAFGLFILLSPFLTAMVGFEYGALCDLAAAGAAYWFFVDHYRESIYVRDLMHGRHFKCDSVVELARKEAWLTTVVSYLRQVMVSAKHWDGTERQAIEPLPKDEARQVILRGL